MQDIFIGILLGCYFGYKLKEILDRPYDIPETTKQYLANNQPPPKCSACLMCEELPRSGDYFCSDECAKEAKRQQA